MPPGLLVTVPGPVFVTLRANDTTGGVIVKVCAVDTPPPGVGVNTVTDAVPAVAMSVAGIAAVSWVALTTVVVRAAPFHRTTELATKFDPVTVSVNAGPPAAVLDGDRLVRVRT